MKKTAVGQAVIVEMNKQQLAHLKETELLSLLGNYQLF